MLETSILSDTGREPTQSTSPPRDEPYREPSARRSEPVYRGRRHRSGPIHRLAQIARAVSSFLRSDLDRSRLLAAGAFALVALLLLTSAGLADSYFHRGVSPGSEGGVVLHPTGRELATNADLTIIQASQLDGVAEQLQIAGFRYVRQPFIWSSIEPQQGSFDWSRYDPIVQSLTDRGITVIAVLKGSPGWARSDDARGAADAPPADFATFAAFAQAFVTHYEADLIPFVQIWDRPNVPDNWGGDGDASATYPALLTSAATIIRSVQPSVQVVLAEFEPFPPQGRTDLESLRAVYQSGASVSFDIVAATVDGGGRSPYDRKVDGDRTNVSRAVLFRETMVDAGDGDKPVWATRYGWSAGGGPRQVTARQQAAFVIDGIERAREEWPWMGPMFMWDFLPLPGDPGSSYALLTTDGKSTELFGAVSRFAQTPGSEAAPTGFVPVGARSLRYQGRWTSQELPPQVYRTTAATEDSVTIQFKGSTLTAFLRQSLDAGTISLTLDGEDIGTIPATSLQTLQAVNAPLELVSGLDYGIHELTLTLASEGSLTIGGAVVDRERPSLWPVALMTLAAIAILFIAIRDVAYVVARKTGHLRRSRSADPWFDRPLPQRVSPWMQR